MKIDNRVVKGDCTGNCKVTLPPIKEFLRTMPPIREAFKEELKNFSGYHKTEIGMSESHNLTFATSPIPSAFQHVLPISPLVTPPFSYRPQLQVPFPHPAFCASTVSAIQTYPFPLNPDSFFNANYARTMPMPFPPQYSGPHISTFIAASIGRPPISPIQNILEIPQPKSESPSAPYDGSLESLEDSFKQKSLLSGKAYKSRNVYKSIVRHLFSYIRKNRDDILRILKDAGFSTTEIEHGFFKINYYNDLEREQSSKKNSQATIKKMASKRTIYAYILRETLNSMLHNWGQGKLGKVSEGNSEVYKDVCKHFYEETVKATGQEAQGRTFSL